MSAVFDLDTDGQGALAEQAKVNGITVDQLQSGFFRGVPKAIGMGVLRGGAEAADALQTFGRFFDEPGMDQQSVDQLAADIHHESVDYWTPGANEVGAAGRILGGFSEMALPLMAMGGNPSLLIGTETNKTGKQLVDQGTSAEGATAGAIIQGVATAAGFRIPFLGKSLATRMASGAAGNLAVNAGAAAATRGALTLTGDREQATQFNPADWEARAIDVLTGLAFGGLAHLSAPSVRDAAMTAGNAKHFQEDTAPGIPRDVASSVAHQQAMESAIRDTLAGKPVDLSQTGIHDADFIALPRPFGHLAEVPEELKGVDEAIKESPEQNPERVELAPIDEPVAAGSASPDLAAQPAEQAVTEPSIGPKGNQAEQRVIDPVVSAAHEAVTEKDFPVPTGEIDADGRFVTRSAREVLQAAHEDVATAHNDSKAFDALVGCILFRGNG